MTVDDTLRRYATPSQLKYLDAIEKHGSNQKAAKALGAGRRTIDQAMQRLKDTAARAGYAPEHDMTRTVPSPYVVKGTSTLYDKDGNQALQWVKTSLDRERFDESIKEYISYLTEEVKGLAPPIPPPSFSDADLLSVVAIGDPHIGMFSWDKETGHNFDLKIAERLNVGAVARLLKCSPPSKRCLLLELGDLLHADDSKNATPHSGNSLDVDSRYAKIVQVALRVLQQSISLALERHEHVDVWIVGGNHDPHSSFMVAMCLHNFYSNEPRVTVDLNPGQYRYMTFGKVLIGSHHGHGAKMEQLPGIMADDMAEEWGATEYRYWYLGHVHHKIRKEFPGVICETFGTFAARDAWHAFKGYRAGRDMQLIVHHKDFGEVERHTANIAMLENQVNT